MKRDPSGYWSEIIKGGAGSGNYDGPGQPRFAREGESFSLYDKTPHEGSGKFSGRELDNSKGRYGFGNKVTEYRAQKTKDRVVVVDSRYSRSMGRGGEALNGYINITHYPPSGVAREQHSRDFKGDARREKATKFLHAQYGIKWPL